MMFLTSKFVRWETTCPFTDKMMSRFRKPAKHASDPENQVGTFNIVKEFFLLYIDS